MIGYQDASKKVIENRVQDILRANTGKKFSPMLVVELEQTRRSMMYFKLRERFGSENWMTYWVNPNDFREMGVYGFCGKVSDIHEEIGWAKKEFEVE